MTRESYFSLSHVGRVAINNCNSVKHTTIFCPPNGLRSPRPTFCEFERDVKLRTYFLTCYMASSVLLMTPVQILFTTSAQKMYGRSHEQSVSQSGKPGKGWGNPRAEVSEQCCHHNGHYYSRFACQLQLM